MAGSRLLRLNPAGMHQPVGYTHVVQAQPGRLAYVSGQVSIDPAGNIVHAGDIVSQTRQVFENLKAALAALNTGFDSVIKLNYYAVDGSRLAEIRAVRDEFLAGSEPPASTFVIVKALVRPELLIEVEAVALLPN